MLYKTIVPNSQDLRGETPVEILKVSSKGLDKTASMQKRAAAFQKEIKELKPMAKKAYLHVITTCASQVFGPNRNNDAYNEGPYDFHPPLAKEASMMVHVGDGLQKCHKSYLDGAHVYQEHRTDEEPSGIVKAAMYNKPMHRGELLIEVDADKWAERLHKRASGQDIFLSIGCTVASDLSSCCGHRAHTLDEHCDHIKKHAGMLLEDGTRVAMINDNPKFYDISGVNVPADTMAYVLRKVASGENAQSVIASKYLMNMTRPGLPLNKLSSVLSKLSKIQKEILCKTQDDPLFKDDKDVEDKFLHAIENYDSDEVLDQCNRKAILLSPRVLFKLMGKESPEKDFFDTFADNCNVDCKHLMQDMQNDPGFREHLLDGSFDSTLPADLNLANILQAFVPEMGVSRPALNGKSIRIEIHMGMPAEGHKEAFIEKLKQGDKKDSEEDPEKEEKKEPEKDSEKEEKEQKEDMEKTASLIGQEFRRTYARYVVGFAARNNEDTCNLAMQKLARYTTVNP